MDAGAADAAGEFAPVCPSSSVLRTAQDRVLEKATLTEAGFPVAPYRRVGNADEFRAAIDAVGLPAVLKTARMGYDGKGQAVIEWAGGADEAYAALAGAGELVLEQFVPFEKELSVVCARDANGNTRPFPVRRERPRERNTRPDDSPGPRRQDRRRGRGGTGRGHRFAPGRRRLDRGRDVPHEGRPACWSTNSRRGRTTRGTTRSRRAGPRSTNNWCGRFAACRWATFRCRTPRRWPTCSATCGSKPAATQTLPGRYPCPAYPFTCTANRKFDVRGPQDGPPDGTVWRTKTLWKQAAGAGGDKCAGYKRRGGLRSAACRKIQYEGLRNVG